MKRGQYKRTRQKLQRNRKEYKEALVAKEPILQRIKKHSKENMEL